MPDFILDLKVNGEREAAAAVKNLTQALNDQERAAQAQKRHADAIAGFRKKQADLARQERKEAFDRLGTEEKLLRLEQQRERIQERLVRAQGNAYRTSALQLRLAQTEGNIRTIRAGAGGESFFGKFGELGALLTRFLPALAGFATISGVLERVKGTLERAKETRDIAEQLNMSVGERGAVAAAGRRINLQERMQNSGLLALEASRSAALTGDEKKLAYFTQYLAPGNTTLAQAMLQSLSLNQLGQRISQSLGGPGIQKNDVTGLREILGAGATRMIALFRELGTIDEGRIRQSEHQIETLSNVNRKLEEFNAKLEYLWKSVLVKIIDGITESGKTPAKQAALTALGGMVPGLSLIGLAIAGVQASGDNSPAGSGAGSASQENSNAPRTAGAKPALPPKKIEEDVPMPAADALARIGLFRGGAMVPPIFTSYDRKLSSIVTQLERVNHNLSYTP